MYGMFTHIYHKNQPNVGICIYVSGMDGMIFYHLCLTFSFLFRVAGSNFLLLGLEPWMNLLAEKNKDVFFSKGIYTLYTPPKKKT